MIKNNLENFYKNKRFTKLNPLNEKTEGYFAQFKELKCENKIAL